VASVGSLEYAAPRSVVNRRSRDAAPVGELGRVNQAVGIRSHSHGRLIRVKDSRGFITQPRLSVTLSLATRERRCFERFDLHVVEWVEIGEAVGGPRATSA
jgi:hypothetical protein